MAREWRKVDPLYWQNRVVPEKPHNCNPAESSEMSGEMRRLRCSIYDDCLTYADEVGWRGFNCIKCKTRREYRQGSEEDRDDWHGLADVLRAVLNTPSTVVPGIWTRGKGWT
jgi:hypothetical protein